MASLEINLTGK